MQAAPTVALMTWGLPGLELLGLVELRTDRHAG